MTTRNAVITSVKILLISAGILFLAAVISVTSPHLLTEIPAILTAVKSWLRPPYLYFIINGIIITIVASSRLHHTHHHASPPPSTETEIHAPPPHKVSTHQHDVIAYSYDGGVLVKDVVVADVEERESEIKEVAAEVPAVVEVEKKTWGPPAPYRSPLMRQEALTDFFPERPPVVSRFVHHRRPTKAASPIQGGKALRRVAKPKKQDTLESTWRAITEGRHIPLTRHLKKSDTLEHNDHQINLLDSPSIPEVKKSQTLTDRTNYNSPRITTATTKLKKEPSLGQDELNRRVEAFINKFNEDMRLQRQQSMQQFMEMINRAA